ncbi:MAG: ribosomal RNA small subunit methyltransferase A [Nitrospirae bacterium]|nr:MAG: ribosomal RNA small subunit methyltransferase A [Nitrospirota bacterium]
MKARAAIRPKKALGQHFLVDPNIIKKILAVAAVQKDQTVLEIGPGQGALTRALCEAARQVIAVEIDQTFTPILEALQQQYPHLEVKWEDALTVDYQALPPGTVVVANLPYYLSTPLLCRLLESGLRLARMVLTLQVEVAQRLVAGPGNRDYGSLSVIVQSCAAVERAFSIAPSCFFPRPAVESAVVVISPNPSSMKPQRRQALVHTVKTAFAHRRKTLLNSFREEGWPVEKVVEALQTARIDPMRRAETLSIQEFLALADALFP